MIDKPNGGRRLWSSGTLEQRVQAFMREFTEELDLTAEQIEEVRPIVEEAMKQYIRYDREHLRLRKAAHDRTVAEIREVMEPDQRRKLDELNASSQKRFGNALRRVDGGPGGDSER